MRGLLFKLYQHYKLNDLTVPENLQELIEHQMCQRLPEGFCVGVGERTHRAVTLTQVRERTQALLGEGLVTPGEARRRLDICGECKYNDRRMCSSCVGLVDWARRLVKRNTPRAEWLGVCGIELTALAARVHLKANPDAEGYPPNCWVGKESPRDPV